MIGDVIAQHVAHPGASLDALRVLRLGAYGLCIDGPLGALWYDWLEANISPDNPKAMSTVLVKTALDQVHTQLVGGCACMHACMHACSMHATCMRACMCARPHPDKQVVCGAAGALWRCRRTPTSWQERGELHVRSAASSGQAAAMGLASQTPLLPFLPRMHP
jgi:hypothetical protein